MKKVIIIISCVLLIGVVGYFSGLYKINSLNNHKEEIEPKHQDTIDNSDSKSSFVEESEEPTNNSDNNIVEEPKNNGNNQIDIPNKNESNSTKQKDSTPKKEDKSNNVNSNTNQVTKEDVKVKESETKDSTSSSGNIKEPSSNTSSKNETQESGKVNQEQDNVDKEYEALLKRVYKTESECLETGIEVSLTDTINILGSYCQSVGYKGKIIGYDLYIVYADGMKRYR